MAPMLRAEEGDPLAIRLWPQGVVSLETHWDLQILIGSLAEPVAADIPPGEVTLSLWLGANEDFHIRLRSSLSRAGDSASDEQSAQPVDTVRADRLDHLLDRLPNESDAIFQSRSAATFASANVVHLESMAQHTIVVGVDGVRIGVLTTSDFAAAALVDLSDLDALVLPGITGERWSAWLGALPPETGLRLVVVPSPVIQSLNASNSSATAPAKRRIGNTVALRSGAATSGAPLIVGMDIVPWEMPAAWATLFEDKEQACEAAQQIFRPLSVEQMNFKPGDGTHTPRWNTEHMMGRELLFFSQIYAARDPHIAVIDLNPAQMPDDYRAAHEDWDGKEEARQMQRVSRFSRRFAYLLDGLELDETAPGSTWTPRRLLGQMKQHYAEHSANVVKKYDLPDWPKE